MYNLNMYKKIIILLLSIVSLLISLELIIKKYDLESKYYKKLIYNIENIESNGDSELNIINKNLTNYIKEKNYEKFIRCAKMAGLIPSCRTEIKKTTPNREININTIDKYLKSLNYKDKSKIIEKIDYLKTDKEEVNSWIRENYITSQRDSLNINNEYKNVSYQYIAKGNRPKKILILSDSYGAGVGLVNINDSWPRQLAKMINKDNTYEIILMAQSGAGYNHYKNWIDKAVIDKINPDLVIISYVENDIIYYDLGWDQRSKQFARNIDPQVIEFIKCINNKENKSLLENLLSRFKNTSNLIRYYQCDLRKIKKQYSNNILTEDVIKTYLEIKDKINAPVILFELDKELSKESKYIKSELKKQGISFFDNEKKAKELSKIYCNNLITSCKSSNTNYFDTHYNYNYILDLISSNSNNIKKLISKYSNITNTKFKGDNIIDNDLITELLPITLYKEDISENEKIISFIRSENIYNAISNNNYDSLCSTIDREHVRANLNPNVKGKIIKIRSIYQDKPILVTISGYDQNNELIYLPSNVLKPNDEIEYKININNPSVVFASLIKGCTYKDKKTIKQVPTDSNGTVSGESTNTFYIKKFKGDLAEFKVNIKIN
jgi:hypothetical protein